MDFRIAIAQVSIEDRATKSNLIHNAELLTTLAEPVDLILFPEMFPTGYQMKREFFDLSGRETLAWMKVQAQKYDALVGGSVAISEEARAYNRFYLVAPSGAVEYYDKRHLFAFAGEDKVFTAGKRRVVVAFRGWRLGLQVCFDLRFPESARNFRDYDLLLYTASWPSVRDFAWQHLLVARAIENQCYIAAVNRVGKDSHGNEYIGHSVVLDYMGQTLTNFADYEEGIRVTSCSYAKLCNVRDAFPVQRELTDQ